MKISLEISEAAWAEMKSDYLRDCAEEKAGTSRGDREEIDQIIARAEADNPERWHLATWLASLAGATGLSGGPAPVVDGWELPKYAK